MFFNLIEYSLKQDGDEYIVLANISALPHMKKKEAKQVMDTFRKMGDNMRYTPKDVEKDRKRLREVLKGKQPLGLM